MGVLAVSRDATYRLVQDPMNGVLFWRLIQLLDAEQYDSRRKVFFVLDEFPILTGDQPCPGIHDLFTRLRSRGVTVLITYQAHATLKRVYGDATANIVGLCANVIYLRQADVESSEYASKDLGWERGWETRPSWQHGGPHGSIVTMHEQWYDRPIFSQTELRQLLPARRDHGVSGKALTAELVCAAGGTLISRDKDGTPRDYPTASEEPWGFNYPPEEIDEIPKLQDDIPEYVKRDPRFEDDAADYFERIKETQRIEPLSDAERRAALLGCQRGHAGGHHRMSRPPDRVEQYGDFVAEYRRVRDSRGEELLLVTMRRDTVTPDDTIREREFLIGMDALERFASQEVPKGCFAKPFDRKQP